ncbi:MAG: hypothetical protein ACREDZ_05720 [Kiloniellales bacterium]
MITKPRGWTIVAFGGLFLLLAGCAYSGRIDQSWTQKATWFSYLNGDDMRARCAAGGGEEYRLVLNASYNEQLRSYEIRALPEGGALLTARVQSGSGIPVSRIALDDPLAALRWTKAETRLSQADFERLRAALTSDGLGDPPPAGLRLHSDEFYWLASGCRDGATLFHAWTYDSPDYAGLAFPQQLLAHDDTGLAVNPPHPPKRTARHRTRDNDTQLYFQLQVGQNGLAGHRTFF